MKALVNLVVGVSFILAYLSVHPTHQPGDIGREYIAVTQALTNPTLSANDRALLEMRRDTVASSIRAAYSDELSFQVELVHGVAKETKDAKKDAPVERAIRVTALSLGHFADYDWSVRNAKVLSATPDEKDVNAGVVRFVVTDQNWGGLTARMKTDPRVSHESLVVPR